MHVNLQAQSRNKFNSLSLTTPLRWEKEKARRKKDKGRCVKREGGMPSRRGTTLKCLLLIASLGWCAIHSTGLAQQLSMSPPPEATNKMVRIPGGPFQMGDSFSEGKLCERPVRTVLVNDFYIDQYEVTENLWNSVYLWAIRNGYQFDAGEFRQRPQHPVNNVNWFDAVKWCNARSEQVGLVPAYYVSAEKVPSKVYRKGRVNLRHECVLWDSGYRLPTEAEWEKAARGGFPGGRFPVGLTIDHSLANYYSSSLHSYDTASTRGYCPAYVVRSLVRTRPVGSFIPNGYHLYDMAGNVSE